MRRIFSCLAALVLAVGLVVSLSGGIPSTNMMMVVANTTALRALPTVAMPAGGYVVRLTDGVAGASPQPYTKDVNGVCAADDGGYCIASSNGAYWIAQLAPGAATPTMWGATGNGSTDDTTAFSNSLSWCNAVRGRTLNIGLGRYILNANLTVSQGCTLEGPDSITAAAPSNSPYALTLASALLLGSGDTLTVTSGTVQYLRVFPASLSAPTSMQDALTKIAAFSGTGITIDGGDGDVNHVLVIGFNQCIGSAGTSNPRVILDHLWVDCTNGGLIDSAHDVDEISHIRGWSYFNGPLCSDAETITAVANNGSGAIRLTVGSTSNMATGNTIVVANVGGAVGANGSWTATVIDGTHIDLQGSNFTSTSAAGTETTGQGVVTGFSSVAGIWIGEAVSGTGVPAATTVLAVDPFNKAVWLSNLATASGSETLTFTTGTYTSGGTATLDACARSGTFWKATNSEEVHYTDMFEFGWKVGFNPSAGTQWQKFHNIGCDAFLNENALCLLVDSNALRAQFVGVNITGGPFALNEDTSGSQGSLVRGMYMETATGTVNTRPIIFLSANNDNVDIDGRDAGSAEYILDYDPSGHKTFSGLLRGTMWLNSSLPALAGTVMPSPRVIGTGTWVPNVAFGGGNTGLTYAQRSGTYSINADGQMTLQAKVALSAVGSATGNATLSGFPSPCLLSSSIQTPGAIGFFSGMGTGVSSMAASVNGTNGDEANLLGNSSGTGTSPNLTNSSFTNSGEFFFYMSCPTR